MTENNLLEVLAPVGDMERLYAALDFGADAVYLGGSKLNLRAFADNFTNEQIREERAELVSRLQEEGNEVIDTVFENAPVDEDIAIYMLSQSIRYIGKVDGIVFMKGWEKA